LNPILLYHIIIKIESKKNILFLDMGQEYFVDLFQDI